MRFGIAHSCKKTFINLLPLSLQDNRSKLGRPLQDSFEAELMTSLRIWGPFCTQNSIVGVASVSSQTVRRQVSFNLQKFYSALHKISHTPDRGSLSEDFPCQPDRNLHAVGCVRAHLFHNRQVLIFRAL